MYKNYIKVAIRNIVRQKLSAFVNIVGLAIGLAGCLLIIGFVGHELSFENCHENADNIYRVDGYYTDGDAIFYYENMMAPLAQALQQECAYVKQATTFNYAANVNISVDQNSLTSEQVFYVGPDFFDMFTFPFVEGNPQAMFTGAICGSSNRGFWQADFWRSQSNRSVNINQ